MMFRMNQSHLQPHLFSDLDLLSEKGRQRLEESWAGQFRREFHNRVDERPFAVLYSDEPSRPNVPVNRLLSLETLKSAFGWSDEEMHDQYLFNVQVRYAVGQDNLGEGDFDLRTTYNFRARVCGHMRETGEDLIAGVFEQVADEQAITFKLNTGRLRMDSSQIASNIRRMGRLQLLVEVLQRVHRMLSEADQARYAEEFAPYLKGSSGQYVYHLKGQELDPHLQRMGELMQRLIIELAPAYQPHETYQVLERVFGEQFTLSEDLPQTGSDDEVEDGLSDDPPTDDRAGTALANDELPAAQDLPVALASVEQTSADSPSSPAVQVRPGKEISPTSLRSPDDPEATYRKKNGKGYEGYVVNLTETCDPANPFQLILKVQSAPNLTEDTTLLEEALPGLKARTGVHTLHNDAGFCGPDVDELLRELEVEQVPTALRGRAPDPNRTGLADCDLHLEADGRPVKLVCPHGYAADVMPGRKEGRFSARLTDAACPECRFSKHHAGSKSNTSTCMRFSQVELGRALRRQRMRAYHLGKKSLRAAVEATVGALKRPFNNDKVPVRGSIRLGQMMIASAVMVNIRRIQRYRLAIAKDKRSADKGQTDGSPSGASFLSFVWMHLRRYWLSIRAVQMTPAFGS